MILGKITNKCYRHNYIFYWIPISIWWSFLWTLIKSFVCTSSYVLVTLCYVNWNYIKLLAFGLGTNFQISSICSLGSLREIYTGRTIQYSTVSLAPVCLCSELLVQSVTLKLSWNHHFRDFLCLISESWRLILKIMILWNVTSLSLVAGYHLPSAIFDICLPNYTVLHPVLNYTVLHPGRQLSL
jgi:hypothetical protein